MDQSTFNNQPYPRFDPHTGRRLPKPKEIFTPIEIFMAWSSMIAGYAFCRAFPFSSHPLGSLLYILMLYLVTYIYLIIKRKKLSGISITLSAAAIIISPSLILTANAFFHFLITVYAFAAWCYLVYASNGNCLEKGFSNFLIIDFSKAIFMLPFSSFEKIFSALTTKNNKKGKRIFVKILLGLLIALLPTAIVFALLSYDSNFVALSKKILILDWEDFFLHLFSFIMGIPIAMYLFGALYSSERNKCSDNITAEKCGFLSTKIRCIPLLTALAATCPILLVYCIFFASQWDYYLSAFSGILPDTLTYAEYARSGFFQLCAVSIINLILIALLGLFVRQKEGGPKILIRILSVIFSLITLILMATAFSKLYLYIQRFGLTPLRVYAGWFMIMLAVVFLLVIIKQLFRKFKIIPIGTLVCIVMFGILTLSGIDTWIAEYNTKRFINGSLETIDIAALEELGDAAIPSMVKIVLEMDNKNGTDIRALSFDEVYCYDKEQEQSDYKLLCTIIYNFADREPVKFFSFSFPRMRAEQAIADAKIEKLSLPDSH